jgi:hypothetical protein
MRALDCIKAFSPVNRSTTLALECCNSIMGLCLIMKKKLVIKEISQIVLKSCLSELVPRCCVFARMKKKLVIKEISLNTNVENVKQMLSL